MWSRGSNGESRTESAVIERENALWSGWKWNRCQKNCSGAVKQLAACVGDAGDTGFTSREPRCSRRSVRREDRDIQGVDAFVEKLQRFHGSLKPEKQ